MIPKIIKDFLNKFFHGVMDVKEERINLDQYVVWDFSSEGIVRRDLTPDNIEIVEPFRTVVFEEGFQVKEEIFIHYKDEVNFFYYEVRSIIVDWFGSKPFDIRIIKIKDSDTFYLEFKLDDIYSYLFSSMYIFDDEDKIELYGSLEEWDKRHKNQKLVPWDKIFKNITITDDMEL